MDWCKSRSSALTLYGIDQTIRNADRIAVVEKGRVKEIGSHDELMALPTGHYKKLCNLQDLSSTQGAEKNVEDSTKGKTDDEGHDKPEEGMEKYKEETVTVSTEQEKELAKKASLYGREDVPFFAIGLIGAVFTGIMVSHALKQHGST